MLYLHRVLNVAMITLRSDCCCDYTGVCMLLQLIYRGLNVASTCITLRSECSLYDNTLGPTVALITQRVNRWQNVVIITLRSECCYD